MCRTVLVSTSPLWYPEYNLYVICLVTGFRQVVQVHGPVHWASREVLLQFQLVARLQ